MEDGDENRASGNAAELARVETTVVEVEQGFIKLESLAAEESRLQAAVESATAEEVVILKDESLTESAAVSKLLKVRALRDVQASRRDAAAARVKEQTSDLLAIGSNVRRGLSLTIQKLQMSRRERARLICEDLFPRHLRLPISLRELAHEMKIVVEARQLEMEVSQLAHHVPQIELADLRNARGWYEKIKALCLSEPGLDLLKNLSKKATATVEPAELVEAQPQEAAA